MNYYIFIMFSTSQSVVAEVLNNVWKFSNFEFVKISQHQEVIQKLLPFILSFKTSAEVYQKFQIKSAKLSI